MANKFDPLQNLSNVRRAESSRGIIALDKSKKCHTKAPLNKWERILILDAGSEDNWLPNCLFLAIKNISNFILDYHGLIALL